jgi:hypothetical protein
MERRLAAILVADVVGYSRLMADDEEGTLARLKAHHSEWIAFPDCAVRGENLDALNPMALHRQRHANGTLPSLFIVGHWQRWSVTLT